MIKIILTLMTLLLCTVSSAFGALETPEYGTVWDNVTGLMWQQEHASTVTQWGQDDPVCPSQAAGPTSALCYCDRLELNSHDDWRLPDRNELQTIVDYSRTDPAINTSAFPSTISSFYWTSSTAQNYDRENKNSAWMINFRYGTVMNDVKTEAHNVRCVRGRLYRITSTAIGPGPGTITPDVAEEGDYGTAVTYTMTPNSGEIITKIVVDSETIPPPPGGYVQDQSETYTFPANTAGRHVIEVAFSKFNMYLVKATAGQYGTISPSGITFVDHGEILQFTLTADDDYRIDEVTGCNGTLKGNIYITDKITSDCEVTASFTEDSFPWLMFLPAFITAQ